jgi:hypothetical protein
VLLACGLLFGVLTFVGSLYYAFGMDSTSEALFRMAQATCFTTEGAESVERCAPLTQATVDGESLRFFSAIGFTSWLVVILLAGLSGWLLVTRRASSGRRPVLPRWAAWLFAVGCGWLVLSSLDRLWDEEYAEGVSDRATGVLSQFFPAFVGESSARVWLGSTGATDAAIGRLVGQAFVVWVAAMLTVSIVVLVSRPSGTPSSPSA